MTRASAGLLAVLVATLGACSGPESPGSKSEYSVLQAVEYQNRDKPISVPELTTIQGYELLALPASGIPSPPIHQGRTWIMLKAQHEPLWKQIPQTEAYTVPQSLLDELVREKRVSPVAEQILRAHVSR